MTAGSETEPTGVERGYGRIISRVMDERKMSIRALEKSTGICRKRLARITHGACTSKAEDVLIFKALNINGLKAYLAVDEQGTTEAYFAPELEVLCNFTRQLGTRLVEESAARDRSFEPMMEQMLTPLVVDVTARVMRHQDLVKERVSDFLG